MGLGLVPAILAAGASPAHAAASDVKITEWEYNGSEFVELTNLGATVVDFTGWSFDDDSRTAGSLSLSGFGLVQAGESVLISEVSAAAFRTEWSLPDSVKVIGSNPQNLGRLDEINIYDNTSTLVDRLTYNDQGTGSVKGPRTDTASAWVPSAAVGANTASAWVRSTVSDAEGSKTSVGGFIGSPGTSTLAPHLGTAHDIVINEIRSNPNPDLVELLNTGAAPVDITGWKVLDNDPAHSPAVITTAPTSLAPGAYFTFDPNALTGGFGLGSGDSVTIFQADGTTVVDSYNWASLGAHLTPSWGRCPDGSGTLVQNLSSTPGAANACPPPAAPDVRLNEVESNGDVVGDWVEITNAGDATADVSGWKVVDSDGSHPFAVVPAGTTLAPGAFYALYTEFPPPGFGLGADDTVHLYRADGTTQVDEFSWTGGHAATTYGRCPDGTGAWQVTTVATRGTANACSPIRVNEISSDPTDWVELVNLSAADIDVAGWTIKDSGDANPTTLPSPSVVPAHGHLLVSTLAAGLDSADSVRLFDPSSALIDSYSWTTHGVPTYGRCADGVGAFKQTETATPGATNDCPGLQTVPWPGSQAVATSDLDTTFTQDASGLVFDPADPTTLWVAANKKGTLFKLTKDGDTWVPAPSWPTGRDVHYPDGTGGPDSEGITIGPDAAIYLATERNNEASGVSKNAVLRYEPETSMSATDEWDLNGLLPTVGANLGLEGITWVPDDYLVGTGFVDQSTSSAYDPSSYPDHGSGLYIVAVEGTGKLYALALDQTAAVNETPHLVATIDPQLLTNAGPASVMDVSWDPELDLLQAVCDDSCNGVSVTLAVGDDGAFAVDAAYDRPAGMPNLNNEGLALAPRSTCVDGAKEVVWSDDGDTGGHSLRSGTFPCTPIPALSLVAAPGIDGNAVVGSTLTLTGGTWDPEPDTRTIQWLRDGTPIDGATGSSLLLTADDIGTAISVRVRATRSGYVDAEESSDPVTVADQVTPTVAGTDVTVAYGRATTMHVTVDAGAVTPTGRVVLRTGGTLLGVGNLSGGAATATIAPKKVGPGMHDVTITYAGDASVKAGTGTATLTVTKATPTVLGSSTTVDYGQPTTMPVRVGAPGVVPTGTVIVKLDDVELGSSELLTGMTGVTIDALALPPGRHEVTVSYAGDEFVAAGERTAVVLVRKATATVTGADVEMAYSERTTMEVTVTAPDLVPTGRVVLKVGDVVLGTGTLTDGAATASIAARRLLVGTYEVTVRYTGDAYVKPANTTAKLVVTP